MGKTYRYDEDSFGYDAGNMSRQELKRRKKQERAVRKEQERSHDPELIHAEEDE